MFPIRDVAGRTVAFTGRSLEKDEQAKYLNSPETNLFKKSEILFGMDKAKDAIRARGFAILVEGQFDLLLLHQAGFANTIALSGTALSSTHLGLIKRYADNLMLALDADKAGLSAAARSAQCGARGRHARESRPPAGGEGPGGRRRRGRRSAGFRRAREEMRSPSSSSSFPSSQPARPTISSSCAGWRRRCCPWWLP